MAGRGAAARGAKALFWALLAASAATVVLAGCHKPQSTRLSLGDLNALVAQMASRLAGSDFLRDRTSQSPPITVVINKVENLTYDVIPPAEQWMLMARVRASLPIQTVGRQKNVFFQITPERVAALREMGFEVDQEPAPPATHLMTATFRSSERIGGGKAGEPANVREDYYYLEYRIVELASGRVVWSDAFEFKRQAKGRLID